MDGTGLKGETIAAGRGWEADADLDAHELHSALEAAVASLSERQRLAWRLVRVERRSYREAADAMGIGVSQIDRLLGSAELHLAERLEDWRPGRQGPGGGGESRK
jgi:RNA polymerase sigma factor (sigma-70 family)